MDNLIRIDYWYKAYEENRVAARFHASQRATISNIILTISGGIVAFVGYKNFANDPSLIILLIFVAILNAFGWAFVEQLSERERMHFARAYAYFDAIDEKYSTLRMRELCRVGTAQHVKDYGVTEGFQKMRITNLWKRFHFVIGVAAIIAACAIPLI